MERCLPVSSSGRASVGRYPNYYAANLPKFVKVVLSGTGGDAFWGIPGDITKR